MRYIITKFGGTSVSSRKTWDNILSITQDHIRNGLKPIIVCSALTQISNKLEQAIEAALLKQHIAIRDDIQAAYAQLANELQVPFSLVNEELVLLEQWLNGIALLQHAPAKTRAQILSLGELMMTKLGHQFLIQQDLPCAFFDIREALIVTDTPSDETNAYLNARCEAKENIVLQERFLADPSGAVITQGFYAANQQGETVLLGRGGSDTSAALMAALFNATACEIWTDVPGIYTANPHQFPHARLIRELSFNEAQEIASMGAKVLHPNCINPVRQANIPMYVKYTHFPAHSGTRISHEHDPLAPPIKSIQVKHSITLISIDTLNMWHQVGFLADVFAVFKQHGFSVDLLSSSEFNVTVSLDKPQKAYPRQAVEALITQLNQLGRARLIEPCSAISLIGHPIRTILPKLDCALAVFEAKQIHLLSLASNDLNLTFVVDESHAEKLCQELHTLLIENNPQSFYYSKSFHEEFGIPSEREPYWWEINRQKLLNLAQTKSPCYVYDCQTQIKRADELKSITAIDKLFYAVKANYHEDILKTLENKDIGFECVSIQELQYVFNLFPTIAPERIIFTPNFAPKEEYLFALSTGCIITIDNIHPIKEWGNLFNNRSIFLRVDTGSGTGHHKFVSTGGNESKFGIPGSDMAYVATLVREHGIQVTGLHAHSGSGILTHALWQDTAQLLSEFRSFFPDIKVLNLGGGLGVVEKPGQKALDLHALNASLLAIKSQCKGLEFWLEPGRYFVSDSGVILATVTQCKEKDNVAFIGIDAGMNSLIRPALYGAYHEIVNLTQLEAEKNRLAHIVGPICESGDTLGYGRLMPTTKEGDVLLIANTGAYGYCMSSHYNLRPPAQEIILNA